MRRIPALLVTLLILALTNVAIAAPPKLVVILCIDQFPYDYIRRFRPNFSRDGFFERLMQKGAHYDNCRHTHAFTLTAPGHATVSTGASPNVHGIVSNAWFNPETGREDFNAVRDRGRTGMPVGVPGVNSRNQSSPKNLLVPTIGDAMKLASTHRTKVFSVALKDRSSILLGGQLADGAFWLDIDTGNWITSRHYMNELPAYLTELNKSRSVERFSQKTWNLVLPRNRYLQPERDDSPYEGGDRGDAKPLGNVFPHVMPSSAQKEYVHMLEMSPFGNELTLEAAELILKKEKLGTREATDLLTVSLSSNDFIGHIFGPQSWEAEDILYRTDRMLVEFLRTIEQQMAGEPWMLYFTSDHGIPPIPELTAAKGIPAARNPLGLGEDIAQDLEGVLQKQLGKPAGGKGYVITASECAIYLNKNLPELAGDRYSTAQRIVRDRMLERKEVASAWTRDAILSGGGSDKMIDAFRRSFHPTRSGDVLYILQPFYIQFFSKSYESYRTTHGTPWEYDAHIPLFVLGAGVRPGLYHRSVSPATIAPTIASTLGIAPPAAAQEDTLREAIGGR